MSQSQSLPTTTPDRLREVIVETIQIDAAVLKAAIGQLVVATSAEHPEAPADARSVHDAAAGVTVLLADRISTGHEAQVLAAEIERHHGRAAALAVLGESMLFEEGDKILNGKSNSDFAIWVSRVAQELGADGIYDNSYRQYFSRGMTPSEAVLHKRITTEIIDKDGAIRGLVFLNASTTRGAALCFAIRRGLPGGFTTTFMVEGRDFRTVYRSAVRAIAERYMFSDNDELIKRMDDSVDVFLKKYNLKLTEVRFEQVSRIDSPAIIPKRFREDGSLRYLKFVKGEVNRPEAIAVMFRMPGLPSRTASFPLAGRDFDAVYKEAVRDLAKHIGVIDNSPLLAEMLATGDAFRIRYGLPMDSMSQNLEQTQPTAARLREVLAETIQLDAAGLQAAIGQLVVATSTEYPAAPADARSVHDAAGGITVLLADRIPAGQEIQALVVEIERHHGREAAQAVLGDQAEEVLGADVDLADRIVPAKTLDEYRMLLDQWRAADGTLKSSDIDEGVRSRTVVEIEALSDALDRSPFALDAQGKLAAVAGVQAGARVEVIQERDDGSSPGL